MHKFFAIAALFILCGTVGFTRVGQQKPAPAQTQTSDGPAVPVEFHAKIGDFKNDVSQQQLSIVNLNAYYKANYDSIQEKIKTDNQMIAQQKTEALKAMNLDPKEWDIDTEKYVAVKKQAPPAAKPAETPKPAEKPKQ